MKKHVKLPVLATAVLAFACLLYFPLFQNHKAQQAFALLTMIAILWVTEAIPLAMTSLMIPVAAILLKLVPPRLAFAEFAHPILFLFMGGFVLAGALSRHALDKMLARQLIRLARGNFYKSAILLMLATSLVACWVSNTSSTAMMMPLGLGILVLVNKGKVSAESKFLMLGIAYSASIGGIVTMVSSPPNAIGAAILGFTFSGWLRYSVPIFLITFPLMVTVLTLYFKPDRKMHIGAMVFETEKSAPRKTLAAIFFFTVILWTLEGILSPLLGITDSFNSVVAIVAILLILITHILSWDELMSSIQWDILLLFGGGLTLGMLIDKSGLGAILVAGVADMITIVPMFVFIWIVIASSIVLTEFMSNTASAAMILPLLFTLANQLQINPVILVLPATIAASYGFMLPVGTPPNAMVFSSGLVPQHDMIKAGFMLNLIFSLILTSFFYLVFGK